MSRMAERPALGEAKCSWVLAEFSRPESRNSDSRIPAACCTTATSMCKFFHL